MASPKVGLVLSGGGVRGAYEVGVLAALVEALGLGPDDPSPFHIYAGTSVGAINAAYMVANADRGDLAIGDLMDVYKNLRVASHLRLNVRKGSDDSMKPRAFMTSASGSHLPSWNSSPCARFSSVTFAK